MNNFLIYIIIAVALFSFLFLYKKLKKPKIKTPDQKWRKSLAQTIKYDNVYPEDIPKITNYFLEIAKNFTSFKIHKNEGFNVLKSSTAVELRAEFKKYNFKIFFNEYNSITIKIKNNNFEYFLDIFKQSDLYKLHNPLSKIEPNTDDEKNIYEFRNDLFNNYLNAYAKVYNPFLSITRNPEKIPTEKDKNDIWSSDDINRIFIEKGIYIEAYNIFIDTYLTVYNSFNQNFKNKMLSFINNEKINSLEFLFDEIFIKISAENLLLKPVSAVINSVDMLINIAEEISTVPVDIQNIKINKNQTVTEKYRIVSCTYCSSKYPLINNCKCPNCGASFQ